VRSEDSENVQWVGTERSGAVKVPSRIDPSVMVPSRIAPESSDQEEAEPREDRSELPF
jgi:hypothetical protein